MVDNLLFIPIYRCITNDQSVLLPANPDAHFRTESIGPFSKTCESCALIYTGPWKSPDFTDDEYFVTMRCQCKGEARFDETPNMIKLSKSNIYIPIYLQVNPESFYF